MKWPWSRQPETAPTIDVDAIARAVAAQMAPVVREEVRSEVQQQIAADALATVDRAMISNSPMPGALTPGTYTGRPYAFDNPMWYASPMAPTRRPGSQVDLRTLRSLADTYDVLRACIQHLKREVAAVPLEFVARDKKDKSAATVAAIKAMQDFLTEEGGLGGEGSDRDEFEAQIVEDVCVIGASATWYHPTRGGGVYEVEVIDASTIRPCIDAFGWPGPGEHVYQQYVLGMLIAGFTREEMRYKGLPICKRSYTPYYWSPIEWLIYVVESALRADQWNRAWLTDGNSASQMIALGTAQEKAQLTPSQAQEWISLWEIMRSGDSAARQKTAFLPGGSSVLNEQSRKDQDFQEFELWLLRRTCAIMGVQPASIGFAGEQYKVSQGDSMESGSWFGTAPLLAHRKSMYDDLCRRRGYAQIEARNINAREENAKERADRYSVLVMAGIASGNEAREAEGLDPVAGLEEPFMPSTVRPLAQALEPPPDPVEVAKATASVKAQAGGGNGSSNGGGSGSGGSGGGNSNQSRADLPLRATALKQWQTKALGHLKRDKSAMCEFESESISRQISEFVGSRLEGCVHAEAVRALFRQAAEIEDDEAEERDQWAERVTAELAALAECS